MTDIDFDELDKAVNSIMTGGIRPSRPSRPEASKPEDVVPPSVSSTRDTSETNDTSSSASSRSATRVVPARRGGRFMDVVHPSSNMRPGPAGAPSKQVSRSKGTIEPIDTSAYYPAPNENELNDLLANSDLSPTPAASFDEPVLSPFIADAKVDKRPLGSIDASPVEVEEATVDEPTGLVAREATPNGADEEVSSEVSAGEDANDQLAPKVRDRSDDERRTELPDELNVDLLSLETDKTYDSDVPALQSVESSEQKTIPDDTNKPGLLSAGSIAIQRQYQVESSSDTAKNGSIYDTDTYHQPLMHPEQKKSGWMWIVWVVLLLVLGAGGGAAAYFFMFQ